MRLPLFARFINQILQPAQHIFELLATHPYCVDPQSNFFIHQYEGLALHCNHFAEKNGIALNIDPSFVDLANSIKHIRTTPKRQIELQSALLFEVNSNGESRFIRNTISGCYINDDSIPVFDAIEKMREVILSYYPFLEQQIPRLTIPESKYEFYNTGFGYIDPNLCLINRATRILTVQKTKNGYEQATAKKRNFVLLDVSARGQEPQQYFPANWASDPVFPVLHQAWDNSER